MHSSLCYLTLHQAAVKEVTGHGRPRKAVSGATREGYTYFNAVIKTRFA